MSAIGYTSVPRCGTRLARDIVPSLTWRGADLHVAVLWNPDHPGNARQLRAAEAVSGLRLEPVGARDPAEIEKAFVTMTGRRAEGVLVLVDPIFVAERERIADHAMRNRLPAVATSRRDHRKMISRCPTSRCNGPGARDARRGR